MITIAPENGSFRITGEWLASQDFLEYLAEALFLVGYGNHEPVIEDGEERPREYSDLSTVEKLETIDEHIIKDAMNRVRQHRDTIDKEAAKILTAAFVEENLSIE